MNVTGFRKQLSRIVPLLLGFVLSVSAFFAVLFGIAPKVSAEDGPIYRFEIAIPEETSRAGKRQTVNFCSRST